MIGILLAVWTITMVSLVVTGALYIVRLSESTLVLPTCDSFSSHSDPFAAALLSYNAGNTQLDGGDEDVIPCNSLYNKWKKKHTI